MPDDLALFAFAGLGMGPFVGHVGDSCDNALAEAVIALFTSEMIHPRGPWHLREAVAFATLKWVDWLNYRRLLEPIGNIPSADVEARAYEEVRSVPLAA